MLVRLPSLKAIRVFTVVAKHLSFKKAGAELNVTQAAVSHLIKGLEEDIGEPLFVRGHNSLVLTATGTSLLPDIRKGFGFIERAFENIDMRSGKNRLKVASAPAFAAKCLVPFLDEFLGQYPDIDVSVTAAHEVIDYNKENIDIGVRFGAGDYVGYQSEKLFSDSMIAVCRPGYLEQKSIADWPDLLGHVLLHDDSMRFNSTFPDWGNWFAEVGIVDVRSQKGPRFNTASDAIEAAICGTGTLLTRQSLVAQDIRDGRLVRVSDLSLPLDRGFYVVYASHKIQRQTIRCFRDWLVGDLSRRFRICHT